MNRTAKNLLQSLQNLTRETFTYGCCIELDDLYSFDVRNFVCQLSEYTKLMMIMMMMMFVTHIQVVFMENGSAEAHVIKQEFSALMPDEVDTFASFLQRTM